jgi:predicted dehydrogenase
MKPVKTALASYGMSGMVFHGPLLQAHKGFQISLILERHKNNSQGKHPGARLVRKYSDILDDQDIELIIINTPDHTHYELAIAALKAGKHVVIEKPFTLTTRHADEIIELSAERGLMVAVFQNRRWDGDFITVKRIIKEQKLGRLVSFESHFDRFRNYIQDSWKEDEQNGTGTLYNLGSHMIDQALQLFGMPEYIFADVRAMRPGSRVDDSFDIFMHYREIKCLVRGSYLVKEQGPRYILHGTNGSFIKSGIDPQEEDLKSGKIPGSKGWGVEEPSFHGILNRLDNENDIVERIPTKCGNYLDFYDNIYAHLRNGARLAVPASEAREVIRVIEAAYESEKEDKVVYLSDDK